MRDGSKDEFVALRVGSWLHHYCNRGNNLNGELCDIYPTLRTGSSLHSFPTTMATVPYVHQPPYFDEGDYPEIDKRTCRLLGPTALVSKAEFHILTTLNHSSPTDCTKSHGRVCYTITCL